MADRESNYRWYILILAALTHTFAVAMPRMCMPVLFKEILEDLGLSLAEVGTVWGMDALAGVFVGLIGGLLADRFGVKRILTAVCLLAGVTGGLRGVSSDFLSLAILMFLFGLLVWIIPNVVHKTAGIWFPGQGMGLANGILSVGMTVGTMMGSLLSATVMSPLLGGWRNVLFLYATAPIIISFLWFSTGREPNKTESRGKDAATVPFRQALAHVIRIKQVWIIGLILMAQMGALMGMMGYLPLYLREIGWAPAAADSSVAVYAGISTVVTIPLTILSDRLGLRTGILVPALLISATSLGFLPAVEGAAVWALIVIMAATRSGMMALFVTLVMETEGVAGRYAGTAMGLMGTVGMLGGFLSPPLGNSLADLHIGLPFVFWAALSAVGLIGFFFVKETRGAKSELQGVSKARE